MNERTQLNRLTDLGKLCTVTSNRAYLALRDAAKQLTQCQDAHSALEAAEADILANWAAAMNQKRPSPYLLLSWQHELASCRYKLNRLHADVAQARERLEQARSAWQIAHERSDVVKTRLTDARKYFRAAKDEQLFAHIEDLHQHQRTTA